MIDHSSELTLNIATPVGKKFRCNTTFIGIHSNAYILTELPSSDGGNTRTFFQPGFWCNVKAISHRGEGAFIYFRSQILHVLNKPVPLAIMSIPEGVKLTPLRKEARYQVKLPGAVQFDNSKIECEIRDLSKSGCCFSTSLLAKSLYEGDYATLILRQGNLEVSVEGKICNIQRNSPHRIDHGFELTDKGKVSIRPLLELLNVNGTKIILDHHPTQQEDT
ncbi:PilZ domain-containing protein [Vibrio aerogenes]|nr:flagellar brake protein [Vibrio aerogenes]